MRVTDYSADGRREREILTAMILDPAALGQIAGRWTKPMFASDWCDVVGAWCVKHHRKYRDAPGRGIRAHLEVFATRRRPDDPTVTAIGEFLASLSQAALEPSTASTQHLLDVANEHFLKARLQRAAQGALDCLQAGQIEEAVRKIESFSRPSIGSTSGTHFFIDHDEVFGLSDDEYNPLIEFGGALTDLDKFFQGHLEPEGFISFFAPNKTAKSFFLMEMGFRAMCQRKRVAYFVVGDLTKKQFEWRLCVRAAAHPRRSLTGHWPYEIKWPTFIQRPPQGEWVATVKHEMLKFEDRLDRHLAWEACQKVTRTQVKSNQSYFYLRCYPNGGATVADIQAELEAQEMQGFCSDIVIIDYADNLGPLDPSQTRRDQINMTWDALSALRMTRHCLLITATQADSASFNKPLLDKSNFSEDRRKLDHVTGMISINMLPKEREQGTCRLSWAALREVDISHLQVIHVALCLGLSCPLVRATF